MQAAPPSLDEDDVLKTCNTMARAFSALLATHEKSNAGAGTARTPKVSLLDNFFASIVKQLVSYEGTRELAISALRSSAAADVTPSKKPSPPFMPPPERRRMSVPAGLPHKVGIFERGIQWEKLRQAKLATIRQQKLDAALVPMQARRPSKYDHVESVMKRERMAEELEQQRAEAEAERLAIEAAAEKARREARLVAETRLREEAKAADLAIAAALAKRAREEAARKAEEVRLAREASEAAERERLRKITEVQATFGSHGLERRPSMPSKMVWRVSSPSSLTSNVAHEYRIKDKVTNTKGVSFVMGRTMDNDDDVVQCVLFDDADFDEHKAAVWWRDHEHRFAAQKRREAIAAAAAMHAGKPAAVALAHARRAEFSRQATDLALNAVAAETVHASCAQPEPLAPADSRLMPGGLRARSAPQANNN
jgi:hypothetical protein